MSKTQPYTWKPEEYVSITNVSNENLVLQLDSGLLRLDMGRTLRLTASALENNQVMGLLNAGKLKIVKYTSGKGVTSRVLDELQNG